VTYFIALAELKQIPIDEFGSQIQVQIVFIGCEPETSPINMIKFIKYIDEIALEPDYTNHNKYKAAYRV